MRFKFNFLLFKIFGAISNVWRLKFCYCNSIFISASWNSNIFRHYGNTNCCKSIKYVSDSGGRLRIHIGAHPSQVWHQCHASIDIFLWNNKQNHHRPVPQRKQCAVWILEVEKLGHILGSCGNGSSRGYMQVGGKVFKFLVWIKHLWKSNWDKETVKMSTPLGSTDLDMLRLKLVKLA